MLHPPTRTDRVGLTFGQWYEKHKVFHSGIDLNYGIGSQDFGQPVITPTHAVVEYVSSYSYNGGLGHFIVLYHIYHAVWTRYLHLDKMYVKIGQILKPEQEIGTLGMTGTTSPHLHFEVLNSNGLQFIKNHSLPYGRYPSRLSKEAVFSMFLDPERWLAESIDPFSTEELTRRLKVARKAILRAKGMRKVRLERFIERVQRLLLP